MMHRSQIVGGVIFGLLLTMPVLLPLIGEGYLTGLIIKAMLLAIAALSLDHLIGQQFLLIC